MTRPTLLIALSLVASTFCRAQDEGAEAARREREREAARAIRLIGGSFYLDEQPPGSPVTGLSLNPATDEALGLALAFTELETLDLYHGDLTDAGLARIGRMTRLKRLTITRTALPDAGLAHLGRLPELESLTIRDTPITDAGLAHLGDLPQLQDLRIDNAPISDDGLAHLARLPKVQTIFLYDTAVTDVGVSRLKEALPYTLVHVHRERGWDGWAWSVAAAGAVVGVGAALAYMVRRAHRGRRPWVWKAAFVATLIGLVGVGLWRLAPVMSPVQDGDAGSFWLRATGLDVGAKHPVDMGGVYRPRDGWFIYYDQGFHGQFLYRVPEADVRARFPEVVGRLQNAPPGRLRPHVEQGLREWLRTRAGPDDLTGFLAKLDEARYKQRVNRPQTLEEYVRDRESDLGDRWERFGRYRWNVRFELAYLSGLVVFAAWPWLRGWGRVGWTIHVGLVPTLLLIPYWLGYAQYSLTSAGPSGGVLYPWLIVLASPLRELSWTWADVAILRALPQPLEPLSQTPGPMLSLSGFGVVGPVATLVAGVAVFVAVVYGPRLVRWLAARIPQPAG